MAVPKVSAAVPPAIKVVSPAAPNPANAPAVPPIAQMTAPSSPSDLAASPENTRVFKAGIWIATGLVVAVVGGGAIFAYRFLHPKEEAAAPITVHKSTAPQPKGAPAPDANASAEEPSAPSTHEPVVASPQSLPGKMIGKARDVVAAREQSGQVSGVGEVMDDSPTRVPAGRETSSVRTVNPTANARNTPLDASAPPMDAAVDKPAAPPASIAFRAFVANLRVSGVFQGEPGRALLNGKTIRVGDIADNTLGIRLVSLDSDRKILYFEDNNGSTMQRRY